MSVKSASKRKTTIYDIAQAAQASPSTVSLALTDSWKKHRISPKTVEKIRKIAEEKGYSANRQARGLRQSKSGIAGMILPEHKNRFFSELSQSFALQARSRGLCPAIVFAGYDADLQLESLKNLISFAVDFLVIAGATNPGELSKLCDKHGIKHVFVDHPYTGAPSVVTDNELGAKVLTERMFERAQKMDAQIDLSQSHFLGGEPSSSATMERARGFNFVFDRTGALRSEDTTHLVGYRPRDAERGVAALYDRLSGLPNCLFVNSISCFEGVVRFLAKLEESEIRKCIIGCFDFDPFANLLRFPVSMIHQRADLLASGAFKHFDNDDYRPQKTLVPADLIG